MNELFRLLKFDFVLMHRYNIFIISIAVTLLYIGAFQLLKSYTEVENLIVLVIFNDPALIGFLFSGIMMIFESNENTISALRITPMKFKNYILSRSLILTVVALFCSLSIAIAGSAKGFSVTAYCVSIILSTLIFSFIGIHIAAGERSFNSYIIKALGVILFLTLPFLSFFGIWESFVFYAFPTMPLIELLSLSLQPDVSFDVLLPFLGLGLFWLGLSYFLALQKLKNIES